MCKFLSIHFNIRLNLFLTLNKFSLFYSINIIYLFSIRIEREISDMFGIYFFFGKNLVIDVDVVIRNKGLLKNVILNLQKSEVISYTQLKSVKFLLLSLLDVRVFGDL